MRNDTLRRNAVLGSLADRIPLDASAVHPFGGSSYGANVRHKKPRRNRPVFRMVKALTTAEVVRSPPSRTGCLDEGMIGMELTAARFSRPGPASRLGVDPLAPATHPDAAWR